MSIEEIAAEAEAYDGAAPLDEATLLTLRHHPERVRAQEDADGFALLVDRELSLVVRPEARGRGLGRGLLERALADAGDGELLAWSHGHHPAAAALASSYDFTQVRDLWVMRRPLGDLPPLPSSDVEVRGYRPADAADVVRVNAAAFAHHPEQGAMDEANLAERMAEDWFDPAGLLIAERDGAVVGFHWTKHHTPALGEVYVVGVDPAAQGGGLGKLLTLAGLHHLATTGHTEVLLYVESDNAPAVRVYSGLGFTHAPADTHVQYRR
ncbi:mycothiol synthase [Nocardioides lianchengensis]|uniref:mycothiol synthase n=1 Tax=Nocardioides lianchengensis TaxID=1045774 RepID=UPI000A930E0B|nr:mycothiol synthase [Nocardioides lianchengensis]NYG13393.1 mycothiol synthase [Nocardioides lianchengensis]